MHHLIEIQQRTDNPTLNIILDTIEKNKQILVFVGSKKSAEKVAELIASYQKKQNIAKHMDCERLRDEILSALSNPTLQCERLAKCVEYSVAFHHAGLLQKQKTAIEEGFRKGIIKCIACTPTLAFGVDLPAYRAIIRDLTRFSKNWGSAPISVLEYHQMAGRAGRPNKDILGEAITIAKTEAEKESIYEYFINGDVEEIYSKLAVEPVLRTYILSLIATDIVRSRKQITDFFKKTFWAYQYKDMSRLEKIIDKMLKLLLRFEFINTDKQGKQDFFSALHLGNKQNEQYTTSVLGKRVAQLYLDPVTANNIIVAMKQAKCEKKRNISEKSLTPFVLLHLICTQLELRPLLSVKVNECARIEKQLISQSDNLLVDVPSDYSNNDYEYDEFLKSIKTAMFFEAWINETGEEILLRDFNVRPGELYAKKEQADFLIYSAVEMAKLLQFHDIEKSFQRLRIRVEQGVKEELLSLLRLEGIGRVRARKLYNNKIKDIGDIKKADITTLSKLLGPNLAVSIKKQVGIDVEKMAVKENKRKGQISLMDY